MITLWFLSKRQKIKVLISHKIDSKSPLLDSWLVRDANFITFYQNVHMYRHLAYTVVSRIYAPHFATLALVESVGGAYMRNLTFYLTNTPPLPVPRLDVDIGTLYYRPIEAADLRCPRYY